MELAAVLFSVIGALVALGAALWLMLGFDPMSERYMLVEGGGYTQSQPTGIRLLLKDQSKVAGLATAGAALQLVGVVLGFLAASS